MGYLTGPVNTLADYQVEFNGLLMGPGTPFDIQPGQSFLDMAALKTMDQQRIWADGSWSGPDFADVLLPQMPVGVGGVTAAAFAAAVASFRTTFAPALTPAGLWVKLPSLSPIGIHAKTNKRTLPQDTWNSNYSLGAVQWRCPDPVWQSIPRTVTLAAAATAVSGMVAPLGNFASGTYAAPGVLDAGSTVTAGSSAILTNAGNTPAWPVVVVTGPTTTPFSIILDGNSVTYSPAIPVGQTLTIDYKTGLATLTGNVDRTYALTARNFSAVTASSSVFFSSSGGTATVTIADMWR